FQDRWGYLKQIKTNINGDIVQQYRNGAPFRALILNTPMNNAVDVNADLGVFVQDTWTSRRLTLSPGVRWDHFNSSIPANELPSVTSRRMRSGPAIWAREALSRRCQPSKMETTSPGAWVSLPPGRKRGGRRKNPARDCR